MSIMEDVHLEFAFISLKSDRSALALRRSLFHHNAPTTLRQADCGEGFIKLGGGVIKLLCPEGGQNHVLIHKGLGSDPRFPLALGDLFWSGRVGLAGSDGAAFRP
jgi:hypothetical protein